MLKTRIAGVLVIKDGLVVQSIGFRRYLPIGKPAVAIEFLNAWGIDEIVYLDIDATPSSRGPNFDAITKHASFCQVPLVVGGGIRTLEDITRAVYSGADKVVINTAFVNRPQLVSEGARAFGSQCIVVSLDAQRMDDGSYKIFTGSGTIMTALSPSEAARKAQDLGAGEILLNSIDRDGSKSGYDLELIEQVLGAVSIPVIACGGAGHTSHLLAVARLKASAVAAGNFFNFTEHSVIVAKRYLLENGIDVRMDTYATYAGFGFDVNGRVRKRSDEILEDLRFEYIPPEVI